MFLNSILEYMKGFGYKKDTFIQFFNINDLWNYMYLSKTSLSKPMCSFNKLYTVQSSICTSNNL